MPGENRERISQVEMTVAQQLVTTEQEHDAFQNQVNSVVSFVESQALLNCTLMARLLDDSAVSCMALPGVLNDPGR